MSYRKRSSPHYDLKRKKPVRRRLGVKSRFKDVQGQLPIKPDLRSLNTTQVAKMLREELKKNFPKQKFSVRTEYFSGGSAIDVAYTDGPATEKVENIAKQYEDLNIDPSTGEILSGGNRYVHVRRDLSTDALVKLSKEVERETGLKAGLTLDQSDFHFRDVLWRKSRVKDL